MKPIKILVLPAAGPAVEKEIVATLDNLQKEVGGDIEALNWTEDGLDSFINENGKAEGLPDNGRATWLAHSYFKIGLTTDDRIVGPVVFVGVPDENGDTTGLKPGHLAEIRLALKMVKGV